LNEYQEFLETKRNDFRPDGLLESSIPGSLFGFQRDVVEWALRRGRASIFADCGMGKTPMQLAWAANIPGRVLILAPLAVSAQTVREGAKFGIPVVYARYPEAAPAAQITITNYEMFQHFDPGEYTAVVLDESSILKSYTGKFRNQLISAWASTRYKLACTATPAPNDFMELGNHAEFCGSMSRAEMLAMYFVHDGGETQKWRIKGHAQSPFWEWVCSWAVNISKPSDLGYPNDGFDLPPLEITPHSVGGDVVPEGMLFAMEARTLEERRNARRATIAERVSKTTELAQHNRPMVVWCNLNAESAAATKAIDGAVEIKGSDSNEHKERAMLGFADGSIRVLVTKPSIAGFGLNWQHCADVAFLGISDSYEQFYQAVRRCWRFGQKNTVTVHVVTAETEGAVVRNIERKEHDAAVMRESMVANMGDITRKTIKATSQVKTEYRATMKMDLPEWLPRPRMSK